MSARYLNVGCGSRFNRSWINVDIQPSDKDVKACNILNGLPFDEGHFDAVYNSHVIEHISKPDVVYFLAECFRVLKPDGVLRVVVPDLEQIASLYLQSLKDMDEGNSESESIHEWMVLEMYDQVVRDKSGGEMKHFLAESNDKTQAFIKERWGSEADMLFDAIKKASEPTDKHVTRRKKQKIYDRFITRMNGLSSKIDVKGLILKLLLGSEYETYKNNKVKIDFQKSGELHKWMYDRYSLKKLLLCAGFNDFRVMNAWESSIPDWNQQYLDVDENGRIYKPDSLFVEVKKPVP
jgi:predicted SAM-dependent methyltransferase